MTVSSDSVDITCCNSDCGITFSVPTMWFKMKAQNHSWFYCPNGHHQHYPKESDLDIVRRERDIARQEIARVEQEAAEQRRRAERAEKKTKKLKKRTAAGTCPCCQRTFSNMAIHMRKQHPQFVAEQVTPLKVVK